MSVKRLIAVCDLKELNVKAFCAEHQIGRTTFYAIRQRFEDEGENGLEPRSRAPKHVANKTPVDVEDAIVRIRKELDDEGLDAGAQTIRVHLQNALSELRSVPSASTIWRILSARGLVKADPSKRPAKKYKRFAAERANELWQIDGTDYLLADERTVKIINVIDDGSRYCPASQAHPSESAEAAWSTLCAGFADTAMPARVLSDNAKAFTALLEPLAALGINKTASRPYHPQTCGKVERFHQTQAKWLAARPPAATIEQLQALLDQFRHIYNHHRPHRAIGRNTPAAQWAAMPKTGPADRPLQLAATTTIHHSTVSKHGLAAAGPYLISIGNKHAGNHATTIITTTRADLFIDHHHTRTLTIDPARRVQPLHPRPGRPRKTQP